MWRRIRQFFAACTAFITKKDREFIAQYLNAEEQSLFFRMNKATQKHCLKVAITVADPCFQKDFPIERRPYLIRAALLHDVGKSLSDINVFIKTLFVLYKKYFPQVVIDEGFFQARDEILRPLYYALYVCANHAPLGAQLLNEAGIDNNIVRIVASHHQANCDDQGIRTLQQADALH